MYVNISGTVKKLCEPILYTKHIFSNNQKNEIKALFHTVHILFKNLRRQECLVGLRNPFVRVQK